VFASKVEEVENDATTTDGKTGQPTNALLQRWHCHMHQFFCRIYVNMRIEELFSIIRGDKETPCSILLVMGSQWLALLPYRSCLSQESFLCGVCILYLCQHEFPTSAPFSPTQSKDNAG